MSTEEEASCHRCGHPNNLVEIDLSVDGEPVFRHRVCESCFSWGLSILSRFFDPRQLLDFASYEHKQIPYRAYPRSPMEIPPYDHQKEKEKTAFKQYLIKLFREKQNELRDLLEVEE